MSRVIKANEIVSLLHKMQSPRAGEDALREKFDSIVTFMRDITDNDQLRIEVAHDKSSILVRMNDKRRLPLSHLGSGIEQLLINLL
jgi:hypothetical protein